MGALEERQRSLLGDFFGGLAQRMVCGCIGADRRRRRPGGLSPRGTTSGCYCDLVEVFGDAEAGLAEAGVLGHAFADVGDVALAAVAQGDEAQHFALDLTTLAAVEREVRLHRAVERLVGVELRVDLGAR